MGALPVRRVFVRLAIVLPFVACGGGGNPSAPATPAPTLPPAAVTVSLVDGEGGPVSGVALRVDGVLRAPRTPGGNVFDLDRSLIGHALDAEKDGFLVHQAFVPARDRPLDLFPVPADGSKAWIKSMLYDGVINGNGTLARLTRPVSLVPGASLTALDWARVRDVVEAAGMRMGGITGLPFQMADQPLGGTVAYTFDVDPAMPFTAYFEWSGRGDVIERGAVRFRSLDRMREFRTVLHELTHGFGLSHSDRSRDLMFPAPATDAHSERELLLVAAVKRRPPGTAFEDNVRAATGSQARGASSGSFECGPP
jgi:hypothetical protein